MLKALKLKKKREIACRSLYLHQAFHECYKYSCWFAEKILWDEEVAKDIVGDVFAMICERQMVFMNIRVLRSYLKTCILNASRNYLNRLKRQKKVYREVTYWHNVEERFANATTNPFENLVVREQLSALNEAIEFLPSRTARVVCLMNKGLETDDIATVMEIVPQTVRNLKVYGYEILRTRLRGQYFGARGCK
jgi:RNA polymerase sigma-70 factor (ECF subfamily)